jgi:serine/threonine protein kinase
MDKRADWEKIRPLGSGGQSDVTLVRNSKRQSERADSLTKIRFSLDGDKRSDLAEAIWAYGRQELSSELGALKQFKIPPQGSHQLDPTPGTADYASVERLKNEIKALSENRPGLPKILGHNISERWIVTEFFPQGTLEGHFGRFKGRASTALKAFRSLVQTVASLHRDGYVHRDIKAANVFVRGESELVLGDFGIVFISTGDRVTQDNERVGPRDLMPQWANLGTRHESVEPSSDVYMLGKLLWSMIDGRTVLPREYYDRPIFNLTKTFPNDPDMYTINKILGKCIVEEPQQCIPSAQDLLAMVDAFLVVMSRGGQLLNPGVPRPCHTCGNGFYEAELLHQDNAASLRFWISGSDTKQLTVEIFTCTNCGHCQFFKTSPR